MNKKIILMLFIIVSLLFFSSCDEIRNSNEAGGIIISEGQKADERMEQIISAIKANDKEALKSLFSKKLSMNPMISMVEWIHCLTSFKVALTLGKETAGHLMDQ